jgi:hypothetical protein
VETTEEEERQSSEERMRIKQDALLKCFQNDSRFEEEAKVFQSITHMNVTP